MKCENCKYFQEEVLEDEERVEWGRCHRYAPRPIDSHAIWAVVEKMDWCGEYEVTYAESESDGNARN